MARHLSKIFVILLITLNMHSSLDGVLARPREQSLTQKPVADTLVQTQAARARLSSPRSSSYRYVGSYRPTVRRTIIVHRRPSYFSYGGYYGYSYYYYGGRSVIQLGPVGDIIVSVGVVMAICIFFCCVRCRMQSEEREADEEAMREHLSPSPMSSPDRSMVE